MRIYVTNIIVI